MAFLYRRNDTANWYVGLSLKEQRLLNKKPFSTGTKNKKLAEALLKDVKKDVRTVELTGVDYKASTDEPLYFTEAFELFKLDRKNEGKQLAEDTLQIYSQALKYFYTSCRDKQIQSYTRKDYHNYIQVLNDAGSSQNTKAIYTARLNAVFNFLKNEGYIQKNPWRIVTELVKPIKTKSKEEIDKLLKYAEGKKFYNPVKFMLLSAFRAGEACNLRKKDIDIKRGLIHVTGKGNKTEAIPIIKEMRVFLASLNLPAMSDDDKVFNTYYDALRYFLYRAEKKIGVKFESHDFRKYCLSQLANSGVNIYFVKEYARHSDVKTTLKYYTQADKNKLATEINNRVIFDL